MNSSGRRKLEANNCRLSHRGAEEIPHAEMSSKSNSKETVILSDWIRRALVGVDLSALAGERNVSSKAAHGTDDSSQWPATSRDSMALCSDDYLMPALQVAYSLANQICKEEETGKSPPLSVDWVDNIVVHINNRVGCVSMCDADRRGSASLDSLAFLDSLGFDAGEDKTLRIIYSNRL